MYTDNEILFPHYVIPSLRNIRGAKWAELIDYINKHEETSAEVLAFMSMMINLNGCLPCETDSYRAMRGCAACAQQTLRRYKGTDEDLIEKYEAEFDAMRQYAVDNPSALIQLKDIKVER